MNLQMNANENKIVPEWEIGLGSMYYDGIDCYPYPLCTPASQTSWHAENPASNSGNDPFGYILSAFVFDGPCYCPDYPGIAQDIINSAHAHNLDPLMLAAIGAHESGGWAAICGNPSKPNGGFMQIDVTQIPYYNEPLSNVQNPAWNIEAAALLIATNAAGGCTSSEQMITGYNAGQSYCKDPTAATYCTNSGTQYTYLACVIANRSAILSAGVNFDCAGPPQPLRL